MKHFKKPLFFGVVLFSMIGIVYATSSKSRVNEDKKSVSSSFYGSKVEEVPLNSALSGSTVNTKTMKFEDCTKVLWYETGDYVIKITCTYPTCEQANACAAAMYLGLLVGDVMRPNP